MTTNTVSITKAGSSNWGKTFEVARETATHGVVVKTPEGFRTYQAGEYTRTVGFPVYV